MTAPQPHFSALTRTGFALLGLNGEAGILLEGNANAPEFVALQQHVAYSVAQAVVYDPR